MSTRSWESVLGFGDWVRVIEWSQCVTGWLDWVHQRCVRNWAVCEGEKNTRIQNIPGNAKHWSKRGTHTAYFKVKYAYARITHMCFTTATKAVTISEFMIEWVAKENKWLNVWISSLTYDEKRAPTGVRRTHNQRLPATTKNRQNRKNATSQNERTE